MPMKEKKGQVAPTEEKRRRRRRWRSRESRGGILASTPVKGERGTGREDEGAERRANGRSGVGSRRWRRRGARAGGYAREGRSGLCPGDAISLGAARPHRSGSSISTPATGSTSACRRGGGAEQIKEGASEDEGSVQRTRWEGANRSRREQGLRDSLRKLERLFLWDTF
jgi:hypothetical protein